MLPAQHLYMNGVGTVFTGATISEPSDQPYGERTAVTDSFGNIWYIAAEIQEMA